MIKKKTLKKRKIISLILIIIFLGIFIFSGIKIINYLNDNKKNKDIQEITKESITINNNENIKLEEKYIVNFKLLKNQNLDTVAYLKVPGTNIDYIVVKGKDNSFYLNHNFKKDYNVSGWIFADYHNKFDGNDKNIVIYGHNTMDGSMFGTLKNTLQSDWQNNLENHKIILITENGFSLYQVFSTYTIEPEDYYINTIFSNDNQYINFLNKIKSRSNNNYNLEVNKDDHILTLSSCTANGTKRVVLHAKRIDNEIDDKYIIENN